MEVVAVKKVKIGITLQVLMRSTRLKNKPILELCGREMIAHQIDRLKNAKIPVIIIICTSASPEDQVLVEIAKREGIEAFTGPKEDVLLRLTMAADKYNLDYIIAIAGDNPLTDAEHIDILAEYMSRNNLDYADGVDVLPIGLSAKGVKTTALKKACEIKGEEDTEAWMNYFVKTEGLFRTGKIKAQSWVIDKNFRLTVDTLKDFDLMKRIFEKFYSPNSIFSLAELLVYLSEHPEIAEINKDVIQLPSSHFPFGLKSEYQKYRKYVKKELASFIVNYRKTIREAFNQMFLKKVKIIIVIGDDNKVIGVVTDGDFRRAILDSVPLENSIEAITNKDFLFFSEDYSLNEAKEIFSKTRVMQIPILKDSELVDILLKEDIDSSCMSLSKAKLNLPVVIMAGGRGARLDPFTRILPKPLIPIDNKPVIEIIMDKFAVYGIKTFYISIGYKGKMIKAYFEDFGDKYHISYIEEGKPLGTAGALKFLESKIDSTFIVSNCDIIVEEDYTKIYEFHKKGGYSLTLVGSVQHHVIPYGVCKIKEGGELKEIHEKPGYDVLVNTGLYVLNPSVFKYIPYNENIGIIELIDKLKENKDKVGVYPISEKSWIDIGQWEDYKNC